MTASALVDVLLRDGLAASRRDDSTQALELFEQAMRADPTHALPHYLSGVELAQLGRNDAAEAALARAVLLGPQLAIARFQLGLLQFTTGRVAVALLTWAPLFERAAPEGLRRFAAGFAALARNDAATARAEFEAGLVANTDNEPLNADIRGVLAGLSDAVGEPATDDDQHVLLAAYQNQGRLQ